MAMDKDYILNNVEQISAQDLANAIQQGLVTLQELKETDELDASKRKAIQKILSAADQECEQAWEQCKNGDETQLRDFINKYQASKYADEAQIRIDQLQRKKENAIYEHQNILNRIRLNPNTYSPAEIINFLDDGTVTRCELVNKCGIPDSAIDSAKDIIEKNITVNLELGLTPESIPEGYTEVYFWGGPGSGKTCALGAVLQMAEYKECLTIAAGPGCKYATQLKNIFTHDNIANDFLPAPSPVESTQYLPFTLQLPKEKRSRSVSLIELSGEIFECFFWKNADTQLPTASHENTFNSLIRFLASKNRKLHFFFIDAGRDNKRDQRGLTQGDYLQATATYFTKHQLFDKTTDAIFIVLTKSDLLVDESGNHVPEEKRIEYAKKYLKEQRYGSFVNALKHICEEFSINGGRLTVEPFTLGKVYFQQICNFDGTTASHLVDILLERIPGDKNNNILKFFNA